MLFRAEFLAGIQAGLITVAFRRWRRPTVRAGGTLLTPVGQLTINSVDAVALSTISAADAERAGYASKAALLKELQRTSEGEIYRIELGPLQPDPRIALRDAVADTEVALDDLRSRLARLDARATEGAWTLRTLRALRAHPGVRAGDVCLLLGQEKEAFKINVRKLKNLGLTESLGTGYRLSPRGESFLNSAHTEIP